MSVRTPPPSASTANVLEGQKLHAPSADRNCSAICELLKSAAPPQGRALEIASGTGQHITAFAAAMPQMNWQPSDVIQARLNSIDAYVGEAGLSNVSPAMALDATTIGWHPQMPKMDLIVLSNLLHLISTDECQILISEASKALHLNGILVLYGPFRREGALTSAADTQFDAELQAADPEIGYKDDVTITTLLTDAQMTVLSINKMPANNLAFVTRSTST